MAATVGVVSRAVAEHHGILNLAVVRVGHGKTDAEGQSCRVRRDVLLGAQLAWFTGLGPVTSPPCAALMWAESRTTRERPRRPASPSRCRISSDTGASDRQPQLLTST